MTITVGESGTVELRGLGTEAGEASCAPCGVDVSPDSPSLIVRVERVVVVSLVPSTRHDELRPLWTVHFGSMSSGGLPADRAAA